MKKNKIGRVFVVEESSGRLLGIVTRSDVIKVVHVKEEVFHPSKAQYSMSVQKEMMFVIETEKNSGEEWTASFDELEFSLVSKKVLQIPNGRQISQYTFQALKPGRFLIKLSMDEKLGSTQIGQKQTITYSIIVN